MHLTIADPYLRAAGGHCLDYARIVAREASKAGFEVSAAIDSAAPVEIEAALNVPVLRIFRQEAAEAAPRQITGFGPALRAIMGERATGWLRKTVFGVAGSEVEMVAEQAKLFAEDLRGMLDATVWSAEDRVYFPTVTWAEAAAIAEAARERGGSAPQFCVCLRFDRPPAAWALERLKSAAQATDRVSWFADTRELADEYTAMLGRSVQRVRIPIQYESLRTMAVGRSARPPVRALFLGEARREKGFHLLPDLIAELGRRDDAPPIHFCVQAFRTAAAPDGRIAAATRRLRDLQGENVELIEAALDRPSFERALSEAHILLLPYDPDLYGRRSSGLMVEGLASGLAIVAADQPSWLTRTLAEEGALDRSFLFGEDAGAFADCVIRAARWALAGPYPVPDPPLCATAKPAPWEM